MSPIEHTIVDGLYCRHAGNRGARAQSRGRCLWVHGLGESGLGLEGVLDAPELGDWEHLQVDLVGYGKTLHPDTPLGLSGHAERLLEWISRTDGTSRADGGSLVLIGHSMGGVIGQLMAERRPDLLRAFVNVEGNLSPDDCTWSRRAIDWDEAGFRVEGFRQICHEIFAAAQSDPAHASYYPSVRLAHPATFHRDATELVARSAEEDLAARLGALDLPVVYLYGDPGGTGKHSRALLAAAGVPIVAIADSGHWPFVDQPARFVERVATFLDALDSRRQRP